MYYHVFLHMVCPLRLGKELEISWGLHTATVGSHQHQDATSSSSEPLPSEKMMSVGIRSKMQETGAGWFSSGDSNNNYKKCFCFSAIGCDYESKSTTLADTSLLHIVKLCLTTVDPVTKLCTQD